jgi:hypothetical protein
MRAAAALAILMVSAAARAEGPTLYPIYAHLPGSAHNAQAQRMFAEAAARYRLGPLEVMDIPAPPPPRAPELLRRAAEDPARSAGLLDEAAAEVMTTGGAGLKHGELADLFLYQAIAAPPARAHEAYLRAAVLAPDRELEGPRFSPAAIAAFKAAAAEIARRPTGSITVTAGPTAEINIDCGPTRLSPATATGLPYGEHFVRVAEVGHKPWAAMVTLTQATLPIEPSPTDPLSLDVGQAAAHARRMNARFALVATLHIGAPLELSLDLVDASTGARRDSAVVPFAGGAATLEGAVMRLDEEARRTELAGDRLPFASVPDLPAAAGPRLGSDPAGWARTHWPLVTAVGVALATAILLGVAVATDTHP